MSERSKAYFHGILLMCKAAIGFSIMVLCVKFASRSLPGMEIVFARGTIGSLMLLAVMLHQRIPVFGTGDYGLLLWRGINGYIALALHFITIAALPLGTAVMLNYTGPIFAVLFAIIFLKERPGLFLLAMILVSFLGVDFLLGSEKQPFNFMVFLGILSAIFSGLAYVNISEIAGRQSPLSIIFYFTLITSVGSVFFFPVFVWPDPLTWLCLIVIGISSFYAQIWFTESLSFAPASLVSPFIYLTPLLSFIYGLIFFEEKLTVISALGAFLILLSGSLISYRETRNKPEAIPPSE